MKRIGLAVGAVLILAAPVLAEQYPWGEIEYGGNVRVDGYGDWGEVGYDWWDYYVHIDGFGDWVWIEWNGDIRVDGRLWGYMNEYGDVFRDDTGYLFTIEYDSWFDDFHYDGVTAYDPETVFFVLAFEEKFLGYEVGLHDVFDFNQPPRAKARHRTDGSITRIAFTLDALDLDGAIRHAQWEFGDGSVSREFHPVHDYGRTGRFIATVTVWDDGGESARAHAVVKLKSRPPKARFKRKRVRNVPGGVRFTDRSRDRNGAVVAWRWDFGDGATSTERSPWHVYAAPGRYTVTLTVTDSDGETARRVKGVRVRYTVTLHRWRTADGERARRLKGVRVR